MPTQPCANMPLHPCPVCLCPVDYLLFPQLLGISPTTYAMPAFPPTGAIPHHSSWWVGTLSAAITWNSVGHATTHALTWAPGAGRPRLSEQRRTAYWGSAYWAGRACLQTTATCLYRGGRDMPLGYWTACHNHLVYVSGGLLTSWPPATSNLCASASSAHTCCRFRLCFFPLPRRHTTPPQPIWIAHTTFFLPLCILL